MSRPQCREPFAARNAMLGWLVVAPVLVGTSIGRAADKDETIVTVQVTSADDDGPALSRLER